MSKLDTSLEDLTKQKQYDHTETKPDMKGDKFSHSRADKTRNNKPKTDK